MEWIVITSIIIMAVLCGWSFLRYRKKQNALIFERFEVIEKDVEFEARFFLCAIFKDGHTEMVTKSMLTEDDLITEATKYMASLEDGFKKR